MLVNLSTDPGTLKEKIEETVGPAFDLEQRKKLDGIDSGLLEITTSSIDIYNLLILNEGLSTCSVEMRPDGIIIRFQAALETYALIIPYYKLKIYKGKAKEYAFYMDNYHIKVKAARQKVHDFIRKIRHYKAQHWSSVKPY